MSMPPDQDVRHFGRHMRNLGSQFPRPGLQARAHLWPRNALYVQPSHGAHIINPPLLPPKCHAPRSTTTSRFQSQLELRLAGAFVLRWLPALSAWQKLFKILLLAATSKCQVFTITLLLLLQFYLILMGFFLPPTAECIKQGQSIRERITHERASPLWPPSLGWRVPSSEDAQVSKWKEWNRWSWSRRYSPCQTQTQTQTQPSRN